jgi:hypothetical protein
MNIVKLQDTKSTYKNWELFYVLMKKLLKTVIKKASLVTKLQKKKKKNQPMHTLNTGSEGLLLGKLYNTDERNEKDTPCSH